MTSNKKRSSLGLALGISLGLASAGTVVNAGTITDSYATGDTLTAAQMTNIKTVVNGNDTIVNGIIANTQAGALKTAVDGNTTNIGTLTGTVNGHTTSIGNLTTDVANLKSGTGTCTGNPAMAGDTMVRVGAICVDKYEANISGGVARSITGVLPSGATWATAANACARAGKRLPTNAEWQMAAAGTTGTCNNTSTLANTDAHSSCTNSFGVVNMVGNIAEWVADWSGMATTPAALAQNYGIVRGGDATDASQSVEWLRTGMNLGSDIQGTNTIANGFRCVR